jgi:hypothetical protein
MERSSSQKEGSHFIFGNDFGPEEGAMHPTQPKNSYEQQAYSSQNSPSAGNKNQLPHKSQTHRTVMSALEF